jgi:hypothetical protein
MLLLFQMFCEHCFVVPAPRTNVKDALQSFTVHSMRSDGGRKQAGDSGGSSANSGHWLNDGHAAQFCGSGHLS